MARGAPKRSAESDEDEYQGAPKRVKQEQVAVKQERGRRTPASGTTTLGEPSRDASRDASPEASEAEPEAEAEPSLEASLAASLAHLSSDEDAEMDSDDGERDQSDDEGIDWTDQAENLAALARVRQEKTRADISIPQAGVLRSVRLVNFMNHKHFTFDNFGAKINFIVGHNGSGKSAILTAIAIALGARASVTGRGTGVKDLIHRGADKATITVTMLNRGPLAYNPEKYPDTIVIERSFDKRGLNTWKFRAERDGPVLETKKTELDAILSHFSINMDSPMTLLTQDMAKSFLANADEAKLYSFFLGGSSLKELMDNYEDAEGKVTKMKRDVEDSLASFPALKAKMEKLKRIVEAAQKRRQMHIEMEEIRGKIAWSYVVEREEQLVEKRERLEQQQQKIEKYDRALEELNAKEVKHQKNIEKLRAEVEQINNEKGPLRLQKTALKRELDGNKRVRHQRQGVLTDAVADIESKRVEVDALNTRIAARAAQNGAAVDPREAKLRAEIKKCNDMRSNMLRQEPGAKRKVPELQEKLDQEKRTLAGAQHRREEVAGKLETARRQEANLSQQSSDPMAAFGTRMDLVMREIARARWRERPLGPLGQYVQLVDPRYKDIVHGLLGNTMVAFAVRYREDKDQLMRILKRAVDQGYIPGHGGRQLPQIFMHKGDVFDFSGGDLSNRGKTLLSVIKVTNDTVLRILVDLAMVERVFLSPTQEQAQGMIDNLLQGGLQQVTVYSADLFRSTGRSHNNYRDSGPQQAWRGNNLFVQDKAAAISALREQMQALSVERDALVEECKACSVRVRQVEKELADAQRFLANVERGLLESRRKADELEDERVRLQPEDGDALQQAKDEADKLLDEMEHERQKVENELLRLDEDIRKLESSIKAIEDKEAEFQPQSALKMDALAEEGGSLMECQATKEFRMNSRRAAEHTAREMEDVVNGMENELQRWTEGATNLCERPELTETRRTLERRTDALKQSIEEADRRSNINAEEAVRKFNASVKEYRELKGVCDRNLTLVKGIEKALNRRKDVWIMLRDHAATRVSIVFTYNLGTRGFEGTVTFDHQEGRLRLRVNTTAAASARGRTEYAKSANRLSGGERSYSTVCFLLALWETCPTTMACLDEWDVFLDSVNRQLAGSLIMEGAKDMIGKQFILITPLDMGGLQVGGEHNKVIRLGDPERGQGTLPM